MKAIELPEYGSRVVEDLRADDLRFLAVKHPTTVLATIDPTSGLPRLTASSWIGVITLPSGRELRITTKVPVANLFYMLATVAEWPFRPEEIASYAPETTILSVVARYFRDQLLDLDRGGLYRTYLVVGDNLAAVRGRVDFQEDVRRNLVERQRTACVFSEFTRDIPENQLLRQTAHLLSECGLVGDLAADFRRIDFWWSDVCHSRHDADIVSRFTYHRLNEHYRPVHQLAAMLLRWLSPNGREGDRRFPAFLVNMYSLYENFVRHSLAVTGDTTVRVLKPSPLHLDVAGRAHIQPDLLFEQYGEPVLVGDCKYKRTSSRDGSDSDLYQMVAYCTALGLRTGVLIYPRHLEDVDDEIVLRRSPIRLRRTTIDLGRPLSEMSSEVRRLSDHLIGMASDTPASMGVLPV